MSIQLKLDTNALASLFPEGSDIQLKLQQAIIQNIADRFLKNKSIDIQKQLLQAGNAVAESCMAQFLTGPYHSRSLSPGIQDKIKQAVHSQVQETITSTIKDILSDSYIQAQIRTQIQQELKTTIKELSKEFIQSQLKKALADTMSTM